MGESYNRLALTDARQIDIDGVYGGFPGAWGIRGTGLSGYLWVRPPACAAYSNECRLLIVAAVAVW